MRLPFPLTWLALVAMWLLLNGTLALAHVILGMLVALAAVFGLRALQAPAERARAPIAALQLAGLVLVDVVRSNVAVAAIVMHRRTRERNAGFVEIPLELRDPGGLAVLACIVTATPGTSWAGYDSHSGVLTMHILDLLDDEAWVTTIKERYERRLLEIFR
jgi:multicomponent K+:H+ antiporter subunit E